MILQTSSLSDITNQFFNFIVNVFTTAPNHNNSCYPTLLLNNLTFMYHYIIEITNFLESLPFWCFLSAIILQPIYDSHYQANMHSFERNLISIKICFGTSYNFPHYKYERTYSVKDIIQDVQRHSKIFFCSFNYTTSNWNFLCLTHIIYLLESEHSLFYLLHTEQQSN